MRQEAVMNSLSLPEEPAWYAEGLPHVWPPYTQVKHAPPPLAVARTEGCRIILEDGRELVDGIASWWSAAHGYNHPYLIAAAKRQLDVMPHVMFGGLAHEQAYRLAARLSRIAPGRGELARVFFADSGSIACEVAMKIALQYWLNLDKPKKDRLICLHGGYHGDTFGAMSVSDPERGMHKAFRNNIIRHFVLDIPEDEYGFSEFADTFAAIASQSAALIIEPLVQGAGGMRFHSPDVLAEIHRLCREHEVLFIADEIATGFGRTGSMFACEEAGIVPDLLCLGKGLTGGVMTLAATLARESIFEAFLGDTTEQALMHGPTYMANPLACAVANASLDLFEREDRLGDAARIEAHFHAALKPLAALPGVREVRVKGAIGVVELEPGRSEAAALAQAFVEQGVWVRPLGDVLYLMPPLAVSDTELARLTGAMRTVVHSA
jgi:adenosylmethionine-8-amino-7-oxononanoate aminotransferase